MKRRIRIRWLSIAILGWFWSPIVSGQMVVEDYSAGRHDRFAHDREDTVFLGDELQLDLSGVGRVNAGPGRWVTMISPTHFLSVNHARPREGTVTFFAGNDLDGPTTTCQINPNAGRPIDNTDIWLGSLLPSSDCDTSLFTYYSIADPGEYEGQEAVMIGRANGTLRSASTTDMRLGRNRISYVESGDYFRGSADHLVFVDDSATGDLVNSPQQTSPDKLPSETRVANGDSGGPTFVKSAAGGYELIGVHSYLAYEGPESGEQTLVPDRWASVDTYLPTHRNQIYQEVQRDDLDFEFVPSVDVKPVGPVPDREVFVIENSFDCSLDGNVDMQDANCTTWIGALHDLDQLLTAFETVVGDIDLDGEVGFLEFLTVTSNFNQPGQYTDGDFTQDGFVGFADFIRLSSTFGRTPPVRQAASVPEPSGARLLSVAALLLLLRRSTSWRRRDRRQRCS